MQKAVICYPNPDPLVRTGIVSGAGGHSNTISEGYSYILLPGLDQRRFWLVVPRTAQNKKSLDMIAIRLTYVPTYIDEPVPDAKASSSELDHFL